MNQDFRCSDLEAYMFDLVCMKVTEECKFLGICALKGLLALICIRYMLNVLSHKGLPYL